AASLIGCAVMQNPFLYLGLMVGDSMSRKLAWDDTVQKLRSRLYKWKKEAKDYVQKSKIKWAIEGDENSIFFHGIVNKKRSQLSISGVFVDGDLNTDPDVVKDMFKDHFATRFKQPAHGRLKLNISFPNRLSTDQVADMDRSVSRDEIRVAVWNYGENKSPGLDGGSFLKGSNSSFVALIPKVTDAKFVTDFRPISLIGCVYKVVTKILANPLATMFYKLLVSALTGASGFEALLVPQWLRSWLMGALLLNSLFCGLKQGDPLVPYLFILIMESLHISFSRATSDGLFKDTDKESMVASKLGSSSVDASFRRLVRDGVERQQWDDLNYVSGSVTLSASKDKWICDLNGDGVFRVKEIRTILDDIFIPFAADATRWVKYIPIKINGFAWRARLDRLPTRNRGGMADPKGISYGSSSGSLYQVNFIRDPAQRRKTPLVLPWERIPRLDSGVRIRICCGE
nr:RNA-directed DNA polymerase, eukaryota [Tanacetum cinerariifolium]